MIGIVLAGGASHRFGGQAKGLLFLGGRPMGLRVADMLAQFCTRVAIEAAPGLGYEALGLPLVCAPGEHAGKGPLASLTAGLASAPTSERVAFAPCDMPFLTREIYDALAQACQAAPGAYARSAKGEEPLVAILSANMRGALVEALERATLPRTHKVLDGAGAVSIFIAETGAFANVNTSEDLAAAEVRLADHS
jgi:molybdopterin-guanine dinucleotide biosynthesis protein A